MPQGGNLSTNAGGTAVLRHGNMRDPVLGVEAVLPDGRIYSGLRGLAHGKGGSISAEHGIGVAERDDLTRYKSPVELQLMWQLKKALDPKNLLNPSKVLPPEASQAAAGVGA